MRSCFYIICGLLPLVLPPALISRGYLDTWSVAQYTPVSPLSTGDGQTRTQWPDFPKVRLYKAISTGICHAIARVSPTLPILLSLATLVQDIPCRRQGMYNLTTQCWPGAHALTFNCRNDDWNVLDQVRTSSTSS